MQTWPVWCLFDSQTCQSIRMAIGQLLLALLVPVLVTLGARHVARKGNVALVEIEDGSRYDDHQLPSVEEDVNNIVRNLQNSMEVESRLTAAQAVSISLSLQDQKELFYRINERYELGHESARQDVNIEGRLPVDVIELDEEGGGTSNDDGSILVAIVNFAKGELIDSFTVSGAGGEMLPVLPSGDYWYLIARQLRETLLAAQGLFPEETLAGPFLSAEEAALQVIVHPSPTDQQLRAAIVRLVELEALSVQDSALLRDAIALVRFYALHQALVVSVQCKEGRFYIKYRRELRPRKSRSESRFHWLTTALGARPVILDVDIQNAYMCASYHVEVAAPEGLYLGKQRLLPTERQSDFVHRFRLPAGQPHAHFYARNAQPPIRDVEATAADDYTAIDRSQEPSTHLRFEYFETPPGSIFRALIAAIAAWSLIVAIGIVVSRRSGQLNTDAAAFILVFPAVAAAWIGVDKPTGHLLEGTLASRVSLICTTFFSLVAAGLYVANREFSKEANDQVALWWSIDSYFMPLWVTNVWWAVLAVVALVNVIVTSYGASIRTRHFLTQSRKDALSR